MFTEIKNTKLEPGHAVMLMFFIPQFIWSIWYLLARIDGLPSISDTAIFSIGFGI